MVSGNHAMDRVHGRFPVSAGYPKIPRLDRRLGFDRAISGVDDRLRMAKLRLSGNDTGNDFALASGGARLGSGAGEVALTQPVTSDCRGAARHGHHFVVERKAALDLEQISYTCTRFHSHRGARCRLLFDSHAVPVRHCHAGCQRNACGRHSNGGAHQVECHP
jgi:hypothetical protein